MYRKSLKGWAKHADFLAIDNIVLLFSLIIAYWINFGVSNPFINSTYRELIIITLVLNILLIIFMETFKNVLKRSLYRELVITTLHSLLLFMAVSAFLFLSKSGEEVSRAMLTFGIITYGLMTYLIRVFWKQLLKIFFKNATSNALIIVTDKIHASDIISEVTNNNFGRNKLVGLVLTDLQTTAHLTIENIPIVSTMDDLPNYVLKNWVDEVLIAVSPIEELPVDLINSLSLMGVTVHVSLDKTASNNYVKQTIQNIGGLLVITSSMNYASTRQVIIKRFIDILGGIVGCLITGILYLFLAPAIKRESPGPVFFSQERVGKNGKIFKIYKFRSMYLDADKRKAELMEQNKLQDAKMFKMDFDPRIIGNKIDDKGNQITGIGQKIRDWSLDEFPQFFNVLKGDMSLVGTRPPLPSEVELYEAHHKARLSTTPGITGLWQVSGRSNILDFEEVVRLDTQYINNWSVGLDLKILFKTVMVVLKRDGSM